MSEAIDSDRRRHAIDTFRIASKHWRWSSLALRNAPFADVARIADTRRDACRVAAVELATAQRHARPPEPADHRISSRVRVLIMWAAEN